LVNTSNITFYNTTIGRATTEKPSHSETMLAGGNCTG